MSDVEGVGHLCPASRASRDDFFIHFSPILTELDVDRKAHFDYA